MLSGHTQQFIRFLKQEFALPNEQIQVALKQSKRHQGPMQIVLWQYGFITLDQLDQIYQWMMQNPSAMTAE